MTQTSSKVCVLFFSYQLISLSNVITHCAPRKHARSKYKPFLTRCYCLNCKKKTSMSLPICSCSDLEAFSLQIFGDLTKFVIFLVIDLTRHLFILAVVAKESCNPSHVLSKTSVTVMQRPLVTWGWPGKVNKVIRRKAVGGAISQKDLCLALTMCLCRYLHLSFSVCMTTECPGLRWGHRGTILQE